MISYGNPICPITENRATLFCFSENCTRPAFACSYDCLFEEGHTDHRTAEWSIMEEKVRQLIELPLSKEELILLEKQEKQLKIIEEDFKIIKADHERAILKTKQRLNLKEEAEKVISAIQTKKTNGVTGGDMARLIKGMEADSLFKNRKSVEKAMEERNELTNELIEKLKALINEHRQRENDLPKPEQIPNEDPTKKMHIHGGHCQQRRGSNLKWSCLRQNRDGRIPTRIYE
jgi:hypothetical protein